MSNVDSELSNCDSVLLLPKIAQIVQKVIIFFPEMGEEIEP